MSNTLTHLVVAKYILDSNPNLVTNKIIYYLGAIAPDTIGSKPNATRDDKKKAHLRLGISDITWLEKSQMDIFNTNINLFVNKYINNGTLDLNQLSFNIGYLVHLLTDKCNHMTVRQDMLKIANNNGIEQKDREFYEMMVNDLDALDYYLYLKYPFIKNIISEFNNLEELYCIPEYVSCDCIKLSLSWINNIYLNDIREKKVKYLQASNIDEFVDRASEEISTELNVL